MRKMSQRLDRDVYAMVRKLEEDKRNGRRLTVTSVYDSIKQSNSSLARMKKRPLEDAIERVLTRRAEELHEEGGSDSEAALEEPEVKPGKTDAVDRNASLLNRQIAKAWNLSLPKPASVDGAARADTDYGASSERQASGEPKAKRRRTERARKETDRSPPSGISIRDIAGLDDALDQLLHSVYLPLSQTSAYAQLTYQFDNAVLLHGPSGCGKTTLAYAVASHCNRPMIPVSGPSLVGGTSGESEKNIRNIFDEAIALAPCLIFIDEMDSIAGKRDNAQKAMEARMVTELIDGMDRVVRSMRDGRNIVILAATSRPETIDPAIRRRFGVEVPVGMPDEKARKGILECLARHLPTSDDIDFGELANRTPGFNGADLKHVVTAALHAAMSDELQHVLQRERASHPEAYLDVSPSLQNWLLLQESGNDAIKDVRVTSSHFRRAIDRTQPAAKREGFSTIPDTTWDQIGALDDVRKELMMNIIQPIMHPGVYARVGIKPAAGILLWGPPGCGKTLVAKAVANESKANFISIKGPELLNKYVGESERAVRQLFMRAKTSSPCVVFFDEMDALVPRRTDSLSDASARVVNALLTELDGVSDRRGIYVIGATNRPDIIDPAIRRPGRLGTSVYVGLPSADGRVAILRTLYRNTIPDARSGRAVVPERDLEAVARDPRCEHFSGADLGNLMQEAARACLRRTVGDGEDLVVTDEVVDRSISMADWEVALRKVKASVKDIEKYEALARQEEGTFSS
ncbi:hypothetical protein VTK73DRAFT_6399 [Phialemonium thermophilum]|uniref:AAA+ ATPase domain-containing protein n=1 Tax=Phialemonium thermophilum TaxID=223376 RepID=A0ABR3XWV7_9PEZI